MAQAVCLAVLGSLANLPPDFPGARRHTRAGQLLAVEVFALEEQGALDLVSSTTPGAVSTSDLPLTTTPVMRMPSAPTPEEPDLLGLFSLASFCEMTREEPGSVISSQSPLTALGSCCLAAGTCRAGGSLHPAGCEEKDGDTRQRLPRPPGPAERGAAMEPGQPLAAMAFLSPPVWPVTAASLSLSPSSLSCSPPRLIRRFVSVCIQKPQFLKSLAAHFMIPKRLNVSGCHSPDYYY